MFHIGSHRVTKPCILAPMAGITDLPFRRLCYRLGAGLTVAEMLTSDTSLWSSDKSRFRLQHTRNCGLHAVQIVGNDPLQMAEAARRAESSGAEIIDINMGCPAKKVCKKAAGSALLRDEALVARIISSITAAVCVPVTIKIRTGWDTYNKNGPSIARIAEDHGIQALTVHGRTRACKFSGQAEYDTIANIVQTVRIPVIANGDIDSPKKAQQVLRHTQAAAIMVGRAALGNPWLFGQINESLQSTDAYNNTSNKNPTQREIQSVLLRHIADIHDYYGIEKGVRIARKHVGWYLKAFPHSTAFLKIFNRTICADLQIHQLQTFFVNQQDSIIEDKAA